MHKKIPAWAWRTATADDYGIIQTMQHQGSLDITWPDTQALRPWAKHHGWPTPWFDFKQAFMATMLKNKEHFALALQDSGIKLHMLQQEYTLPAEQLIELDELYEQRSADGRPTSWGALVESLREIRRAIEAGVVVHVDNTTLLTNWQQFYQWAHGRYHMLEDGYDQWIGDDS